jgi:hypothetical protein
MDEIFMIPEERAVGPERLAEQYPEGAARTTTIVFLRAILTDLKSKELRISPRLAASIFDKSFQLYSIINYERNRNPIPYFLTNI